jgi:hypothetical protein
MPQNNGVPGGNLFVQTADVTIANSVAETTLLGAGQGSLTLPANFFRTGKTIKIQMRGRVSTTGTPTYRVRIKLGATTVLDTGTVTFAGTISNNQWVVDAVITCRTTGVSGAFMSQGSFHEEPDNRAGMTNTATIAVDTTTSKVIDVTWQWGTASASNTITATNVLVEAER